MIYAKGDATHAAHLMRNTEVRIHQHAFDLGQTPEHLLAEIEAIASTMATGVRELFSGSVTHRLRKEPGA